MLGQLSKLKKSVCLDKSWFENSEEIDFVSLMKKTRFGGWEGKNWNALALGIFSLVTEC